MEYKKDRFTDALVLAETKEILKENWLKLRQSGVGGSDAGAILGVNKWKSPIAVYFDKIREPVNKENEKMYWGNKLEDIVADEFGIRNPELKIQRRNAVLVSKENPFMLANIDRLVFRNGEVGILEIKTASEYAKQEWESDSVPDSYYLQVQHYLAVTNVKFGYLAVLIGGQRYKQYEVPRDEDIIKVLIEKEKLFWEENVLKKVMPPWSGLECDTEILKNEFPQSNDSVLEMNYLLDEVNKIKEIKVEVKTLEQEQERLEQIIKDEMQDTGEIKVEKYKVTWKTNKAGKRTFLIK